jgi:hypothetical protein
MQRIHTFGTPTRIDTGHQTAPKTLCRIQRKSDTSFQKIAQKRINLKTLKYRKKQRQKYSKLLIYDISDNLEHKAEETTQEAPLTTVSEPSFLVSEKKANVSLNSQIYNNIMFRNNIAL